jgi:uncharacterized protein YraI
MRCGTPFTVRFAAFAGRDPHSVLTLAKGPVADDRFAGAIFVVLSGGDMRRLLGGLVLVVSLVAAGGLGAVATSPPAAAATFTVQRPLASQSYRVSSWYGPRCMPTRGASTFHEGQDLAATKGTDVKAVAAGTVILAGNSGTGLGQVVAVRHSVNGAAYSTVYAHVVDGDRYVKKGAKVAKGQHIADVGQTGTATGPHLHLEVHSGVWRQAGDKIVDPNAWMRTHGADLAAGATYVAPKPTATSCTYYNAANLNLRTGPSTAYASIRVMQVNTRMTSKPGDSSGTWTRVTAGGRTGWVARSYIGPSWFVLSTQKVVPAAGLRVRSAPSTSASILTVRPQGAKLYQLRPAKNGWMYVAIASATGSRTGYVDVRYIKKA